MRTLREISKELKYLWFWGTGIEMSGLKTGTLICLISSSLFRIFQCLFVYGCFFWNSGLMLDKAGLEAHLGEGF